MFRKFADKLSAAANAVVGNSSEEQAVQTLTSMGFSADRARNALQATNGDVDRAAELLLATVSQHNDDNTMMSHLPTTSSSHNNNNSHNDQEAALNAALQESLQTEEARQLDIARQASHATANINTANSTKTTPLPVQSTAAIRAGQAAVARAARGDDPFPANPSKSAQPLSSHPNVKMPVQLQHKSKEEQLLRCADRMKSFPRAVDTMYIVLTSIQKDPANDKYRRHVSGYEFCS